MRRSGRVNILRRLDALESRTIDGSGLVPHSPEWLDFWQRQVRLYEEGKEHVRLTLEGVRAVMQATPNDNCLDDYAGVADAAPEDLDRTERASRRHECINAPSRAA